MNDQKRGIGVDKYEIELNVNDYLDLYLLAGDLGDTIWQLEIIEQLEALTTERPIKNQPLDKDILWKKYKLINEEIYQLYQHIKKTLYKS